MIDASQIIAAVAASHGLTIEEITGPCRKSELVAARHQAMKLLRDVGMKLKDIAALFGGVDHTSVMYATRTEGVKRSRSVCEDDDVIPPRRHLNLLRLRFKVRFPLMVACFKAGVSIRSIAKVFKFTPGMVSSRFRKAGYQPRPFNGSHCRVNICPCGAPALKVGGKCLRCKRLRNAELARKRYREQNRVPRERWKYQF